MAILSALNAVKNIRDLVDEIHTSDEERGEQDLKKKALLLEAQKIENEVTLAHLEITKAEASHGSTFVAGARPFGRWVGYGLIGIGIGLPFIANTVGAIMNSAGVPWTNVEYLSIDYIIALAGMTGVESGIRSFEKTKGVARSSIK